MKYRKYTRLLPIFLCAMLLWGCKTEKETPPEKPTENIAAPAETASPEPTPDELAEEILSGLSLEEKVGQLFIARCPEENAAQKAADYHLGGYIMFGRDFKDKSREDITAAIESYQNASALPMLIGVDEEGGTVNRVSLNPSLRAVPFHSPQELYAEGGMELIESDTEEKCELLHSLGINVNFAPVCDVSTDEADFIYKRSFGKSAEETSDYVRTVVKTMKSRKMGSVLKHFPGYGNNADTHTDMVYDERPPETFETSDFLPFQAGIEAGADMVLVSHNIVTCIDPDFPASVSEKVHRILREELGFGGVIVTDDLAMEGVHQLAPDSEIAVHAILVGNDLLCSTDFETQLPAVLEAVRNNEISVERIDESVLRILKLKLRLRLIEKNE